MNQPRHYAGEFEDRKLNPAFTLVAVLLLVFLSHYAAFWAGGMLERARAEDAAKRAAPAPRAAVQKADWSQFDCKELRAICWSRAKGKIAEVVR